MAHKLVTGWNDSGLCLNYAGDKIVTMESPAPYANRELKNYFDSGTTDPTITANSDFIKIAATNNSYHSYRFYANMFLVYDGEKNTTLTVSLGSGTESWWSLGLDFKCNKTQIGDHINLTQSDSPSYTFAPIYYRYVLGITFFFNSLSYPLPDLSTIWGKN